MYVTSFMYVLGQLQKLGDRLHTQEEVVNEQSPEEVFPKENVGGLSHSEPEQSLRILLSIMTAQYVFLVQYQLVAVLVLSPLQAYLHKLCL